MPDPPTECSIATTTTIPAAATTIAEGPNYREVADIEMGPTTAALAPELSTSLNPSIEIMSAIAFHAMARRLSWAKAKLAQLIRQIKMQVQQIVQAFEDRCKALTTSVVDQRIAMVDAPVDAFEARVFRRDLLRPSLQIYQPYSQELIKFKADLIALLAAPIPVPETTPLDEPLFDMFEADPPYALGKRPMKETNAEEGHKRQKTFEEDEELEEQITEFVLKRSRENEELRNAQELERLQGIGSSSMVAIQINPQEGDAHRQLETNAQASFDV